MQVAMLGPLEVRTDDSGETLEVGGARLHALQALVSRLRRTLPGAVIESRPSGYQLKLAPGSTGIVRFEQLAATGQDQLRGSSRSSPSARME